MPTNLAIDDALIEQARRAGKHKTKKATVTVALQEYIKMRRRHGLLDLEGQVDFWPGYDHKAVRSKKRRAGSTTTTWPPGSTINCARAESQEARST